MRPLNCILEDILLCLQTQKSNDTAVTDLLEDLLEKTCLIDEGINGNCPLELVAPLTATTAVVEGDQTATNPVGSTFDIKNAAGDVVGTAQVASATYNATTNQTTFTLTNSTVAATALASAQTITKKRVAAKVEEPGKKEETKDATVATRG
jgi:hypothetical protein